MNPLFKILIRLGILQNDRLSIIAFPSDLKKSA